MSEQHGRPQLWGGHPDDSERSLVAAVRWSVLPTMCLPVALASLGASVTGEGLPVSLDLALATLALIANLACWRKIMVLWRALRRRDDDEQGWPRSWDNDPPLDPRGGPGGVTFDWTRFQRDFWAHVKETERQREHDLVRA